MGNKIYSEVYYRYKCGEVSELLIQEHDIAVNRRGIFTKLFYYFNNAEGIPDLHGVYNEYEMSFC